MPVDDHIHAERCGCLHATVDRRLQLCAIPTGNVAFLPRVHREADSIGTPGLKAREALLRNILRKPLKPMCRNALQLKRRAALIHELNASDLETPMLRKRRGCGGL